MSIIIVCQSGLLLQSANNFFLRYCSVTIVTVSGSQHLLCILLLSPLDKDKQDANSDVTFYPLSYHTELATPLSRRPT